MTELNTAPIFWEDSEDANQASRLSSLKQRKKRDLFRFRIDPILEPYLTQLKENFTMFFFIYAYSLEAASIRIYGILNSYHP